MKPKSRADLAQEAVTLARSMKLVRHRSSLYVPVDYETGEPSSDEEPNPERTSWLPLGRDEVEGLAREQFGTLFQNDSELGNFEFMVGQAAMQRNGVAHSLLIRTEAGLRELNGAGVLVPATGDFRPNTLLPMLNVEQGAKDAAYDLVVDWLGSEEEAESLLRHLATSLAPGWSAVKYVLLLGEGRNGKSLLMKMLTDIFGMVNVSHVTRQDMSEGTTAVLDLNGKLLNLVFDGQAQYLKDSGREKSLTAGEPVPIKKLYQSAPVLVQTNSLFIEGLNREPKTNDKSTALQKRLVRYQFTNVYELNVKFERKVRAPEMLGAFLSLLIDRYVDEHHVAAALKPTAKSMQLQLEQMLVNSLGMQFLKFCEETPVKFPQGAVDLLGASIDEVVEEFRAWRTSQLDFNSWTESGVMAQLSPLLDTERKSERVGGQPRKVRRVTAFKDEAAEFIASQRGGEDDDPVRERGDVQPGPVVEP